MRKYFARATRISKTKSEYVFCMLICIMCHSFRSGSGHDKCGIKLKLSTVGVHSCVVLVVSLVAMATAAKN